MNTDNILGIVSICAIFSPILVAIINNIYNYYLKKLELVYKTKQEVLTEFASTIIENHGMNSTAFYQALNKLYIYFDVDDELIKILTENNHLKLELYQQNATKLMKKLAKQIPRI